MNKKIIPFFLICMLLLVLPSCSGGSVTKNNDTPFQPTQAYDKSTLTESELVLLACSALQAGSTETLLDLCATDEYVSSGYAILKTCIQNGNRAGIEYEIPQLSAASKSALVSQMKANYARDIMASLYKIVTVAEGVGSNEVDFEGISISEQAENLEALLQSFDFSKIQIEYISRCSIYDAGELGLLGDSFCLDAEELIGLAEQGPLLAEMGFPETYPIESGCYYVVLSYNGGYYRLCIPVFRYYEAGWRIHGFNIEPIVLGEDNSIPKLEGHSEITFVQSKFDLFHVDTVNIRFETSEDVVQYTLDAFAEGDIDKLNAALQLDTYIANLDMATWFGSAGLNPFSQGTSMDSIAISGMAFPTTADGFAELEQAILQDAFLSKELWRGACSYATAQLSQNETYVDYTSGFSHSILNWHWTDFITQTDLSAGEQEQLRDGFPPDIAKAFFSAVDDYWQMLSNPELLQISPIENGENYYTAIFGSEIWKYRLVRADDTGKSIVLPFCLVISASDNGYRLACLSPS